MCGNRAHHNLCPETHHYGRTDSGSGVQETAQVENIIRNLKQTGEPLILVSHNMRQVFDLVDRIVVFRRGRIVANLTKMKQAARKSSPTLPEPTSNDAPRIPEGCWRISRGKR